MDMNEKPFYVKLPARGLIRVSGPDRHAFLQNVISNDMNLLQTQPSLYACFLSIQGKFLHDFFITDDGATSYVECESHDRAEDLFKRLKLYKLRSKIEMACEPELTVFAAFGGTLPRDAYPDPRHPLMGYRVWHNAPDGHAATPFDVWDEHRIRLGIPDGSRDIKLDRDTLLECNIDKFNGLSHNKGCYIGQEITARMHLRGLVKNHLYTVESTEKLPKPFTDIFAGEKLIGQMRSSCVSIGLALLKDEQIATLESTSLRVI